MDAVVRPSSEDIRRALEEHQREDSRRFDQVDRALAGLSTEPPLSIRLDRLERTGEENAKRANRLQSTMYGILVVVIAEVILRLFPR